jgi:preprotein translocase subunit YajC
MGSAHHICRWTEGDTAMTFGRMQVRTGMSVVDTQGAQVGRVTDVGDEHFSIERGQQGVLTVSYDSVRALLGEQLVLDTGPDLDRSA